MCTRGKYEFGALPRLPTVTMHLLRLKVAAIFSRAAAAAAAAAVAAEVGKAIFSARYLYVPCQYKTYII